MRRLLASGFFCLIAWAAGHDALADHPFDPGRYAYELFSEDEKSISKYAGTLDDEAVIAVLRESWAELDSAAARAAGLPPEQAKSAIQDAVRGPEGVSENFGRRLEKISKIKTPTAPANDRVGRAVRHPAVWVICALFLLVLLWINRRKP